MEQPLLKQFDLSGRIAVITGAGGALCGTIAKALGELDVKIAVLDLEKEKAEQTVQHIMDKGGEAAAFACNVLNKNELIACYEAIKKRWGEPDFLINGAGGNDPRGTTSHEFFSLEDVEDPSVTSFFDLDLQGFQFVFSLNFLGTFLPTQVFARGMAAQGKGAVINISSMSALTPLTKVSAYSAAKAAVANFTQWMAVHFSRTGIRVNALAPGFFMTEQLRFLHIDQETGHYTPRAQKVLAHTPMERYGEPEELVGTVVYLLSDASKFVTGTVIPIDGGFSSYSI